MADALATTEYVVRTIAETAIANEDYFCQLDSAVGDGDFGYSLARGFERLLEEWDDLDRTDVATFLQKVAMVVTSRVGGTSGPIWGTGFLRASMAARKAEQVDAAVVVTMLRDAADGIMARGGASLGEKTLLDALVPMTDAIEASLAEQAPLQDVLNLAATASAQAADSTKSMRAMRGRASYTGDRSIGSVDAGAMAMAVLTKAVADGYPGLQ